MSNFNYFSYVKAIEIKLEFWQAWNQNPFIKINVFMWLCQDAAALDFWFLVLTQTTNTRTISNIIIIILNLINTYTLWYNKTSDNKFIWLIRVNVLIQTFSIMYNASSLFWLLLLPLIHEMNLRSKMVLEWFNLIIMFQSSELLRQPLPGLLWLA